MTSSDPVAFFLAGDHISKNPEEKVTNGIDQKMQEEKFENKGSELPFLDSVDQQMQVTKKIEDLAMFSKQTENLMDKNI